MEATELRIGNYLKYNSEIKLVSSIHNDNTIRFKDGSSSIGCFIIKNKNIKPIPLTEEILLKCGFALKQHDTSCSITIAKKNLIILHSLKSRKQWIFQSYTVNLQYLHQLQNLYHALTGEELTVNF